MNTHNSTALWEVIASAHLIKKDGLSFSEAQLRISAFRTTLANLADALDAAEGIVPVEALQRATWGLVDALDMADHSSVDLPEVVEVLALQAGRE